jgi:hypothetical protein
MRRNEAAQDRINYRTRSIECESDRGFLNVNNKPADLRKGRTLWQAFIKSEQISFAASPLLSPQATVGKQTRSHNSATAGSIFF